MKQATETKPYLILLAIMMPGLDGYETCRRLKQQITTQDIPVIFVTARTELSDKVKGFTVGAIDFITKPFYKEEVLARITTHIALYKLQRERELTHMTPLSEQLAPLVL